MNTVLVGYGRMGHVIENILLERGHKVTARVDKSGNGDSSVLTAEILKDADSVIEFALPDGVLDHIKLYAETGTSAVVGTTGLDHLKEDMKILVKDSEIALCYGTNFSIGAHIFFRLSAQAAALVNNVLDYDIMVTEYHHRFKKDSPSGTALTTARNILDNLERKTVIQVEKLDRPIRDEELHVASVRGGNIPGTHSVLLDSVEDSIEVKHTARSRAGFALGAVYAAEWIHDKKGFLTVDDFINDIFKEGDR